MSQFLWHGCFFVISLSSIFIKTTMGGNRMKILVPGKERNATRKFGCINCGCIFEADEGEYRITQKDGYSCICPCCGKVASDIPTDENGYEMWKYRWKRMGFD